MRFLYQNKINPERYEKVKNLMLKLGPPVIDVYEIDEGYYFAIEGSHRLNAAKELGLLPIVNVILKTDFKEDLSYHIDKEILVRISKKLIIDFEVED